MNRSVVVSDNIRQGLYDPRDLDRLQTDEAYARCFLRTLKVRGDVEKALEGVHEALKFRKEIGLLGLMQSADAIRDAIMCCEGQ